MRASSVLENIFDDLPELQAPKAAELHNELARYLSTPQDLSTKDGLQWWYEHKHIYPHLSQMARDYLLIPGKIYSV